MKNITEKEIEKEKNKEIKIEIRDDFYYKKDRLNQLRGFCATVQSKSNITKAAEKLGLEVATVGKQIRSLEKELNIDLFDRNIPNRIKITPEGKLFYDKAVLALQYIDGLFSDFRGDLEYGRKNMLKIATFDAIIRKIIPYTIKFKKRHPEVKFMFYNISKEEAFEKLLENKLDLVIYPTDENDEFSTELKREKIIENIVFLTMHPKSDLVVFDDKQITKDLISKYPFGLFSGIVYSRSFNNFINEYHLEPPINVKSGTIDLIVEMIKNNMCIALLDSYYLTEQDKKHLVLKSRPESFPPMYFYSFCKKGTEHKKLSDEFLKLIKKNKENIFH